MDAERRRQIKLDNEQLQLDAERDTPRFRKDARGSVKRSKSKNKSNK